MTAGAVPVLQVRGLRFAHAGQAALFTDWSLDLAPGVTWVGGDESTGKSTLLRLLAGELRPQTGSLSVRNGITQAGPGAAWRTEVAWADPRSSAFDALTPAAYWDSLCPRYPRWDAALLEDLVGGLALEAHRTKALYMLSAGSKRKVFLAGALASGATVTLLDEPFAALDRASIELVLEFLQDAAGHPSRAWVVADYVAPPGVGLTGRVLLDG